MSDFICFIPFSEPVTFDIEKILQLAAQQWMQDFHCVRADNMYVVGSGFQQLVLAVQDEQFPKELVDGLVSSYSRWSHEEVAQFRNHRVLISIRTPGNPLKSKQQVVLVASTALALLKQVGATGFVNAIAQQYYPLSHFQAYLGETVPRPDELYFMFAKDQNQKR